MLLNARSSEGLLLRAPLSGTCEHGIALRMKLRSSGCLLGLNVLGLPAGFPVFRILKLNASTFRSSAEVSQVLVQIYSEYRLKFWVGCGGFSHNSPSEDVGAMTWPR